MGMPYDVEHEITLVQWYVAKVGKKQVDGTYKCTFGEIFNDEEAEQIFESLVGSLKLRAERVCWISRDKCSSCPCTRTWNFTSPNLCPKVRLSLLLLNLSKTNKHHP